MGRLGDAFDVLRGKKRVARPDLSSNAYSLSGTGSAYPIPGSQFDWARQVGELRHHSVVSVICDWLSRQFLQAPWCSGYENPDKPGEYKNEPTSLLTQLLSTCNRTWGPTQTWASLITDRLIYQQAFAYKARASDAGNLPAELYWLPAKRINVLAERDPRLATTRPIRAYEFRSFSGATYEYPPEDIIHFRGRLDDNNPLVSSPTLLAQSRNSQAINAAEEWTVGVLSFGTSGTLLSPKDGVEHAVQTDEKAMNALVDKIKRFFRGARSSIVSSTQPVEATKIGESPESMMADKIADRPEAMLLAACGLNSLALGLPSSSDTRTYSNLEEARKDAWEHGVMPLQDSMCEDLTAQLAPDFDDSLLLKIWCERKDIAALQEDANERMNRATGGFSSSLFKRNESRVQAGGEPLPDDDPDGELYFGDQTQQAKKDAAEAFQQQQALMAGQPSAVPGDEVNTGDASAAEPPPEEQAPAPPTPSRNGKAKKEPVAA